MQAAAIDPVTASTTNTTSADATATSAQTATNAFGLSFDSLLKIVLTQLTYQDPLKPMDNFQFVSQLAQFSQIQQGQAISDQLAQMVLAQATGQATSLLGKRVDIAAGTATVTGKVTAVSLQNGEARITITTSDDQTIGNLALATVSQIRKGIDMFGAIYVGLSGLKAYSDGLQKVSNNVSNLNSTGFKSSVVSFSSIQNQRDSGGIGLRDGSAGGGGGVGIAASSLDLKAGELRQTDNDLDLAIDGTGFLVLLDGSNVRYTRTGSFQVNEDGFIVLGDTQWKLGMLDGSGHAVALSVDASGTDAPVATTRIVFADNLSSTATSDAISDIAVCDANGVKHVWQLSFTRAENSSDWTIKVTDDAAKTIGEQNLTFANGVPTTETAKLTFTDSAANLSVSLDFSTNVTSFSSGTVSSLRAASVDGQAVGTVTTVSVNADGELELAYSNNEKKQLGAVALASFRDVSDLTQESGGLFVARGGTEMQLLASADTRVGLVRSRRLEASNVDLQEFGDMILIQRGYQASSQIVSVANDMIQQLFGIRGQDDVEGAKLAAVGGSGDVEAAIGRTAQAWAADWLASPPRSCAGPQYPWRTIDVRRA